MKNILNPTTTTSTERILSLLGTWNHIIDRAEDIAWFSYSIFFISDQIIIKTASKALFSSVVERGLQNNTQGYYSTAVLSSPTLMKSSLEVKKCEQKIEKISKSLTQKESERIRLKSELGVLHNLIRKSNNAKSEIKEELVVIRQQVEKKHDEMNRTKANLLFHTKRGYEEMIRRYENEMQFNNRSFNSRQEAHILSEITSLKQGMVLFDNYEEQKKGYDLSKEALTAKKNEQEQIWNQQNENKKKYHHLNDELKNITHEIQQLNEELKELETCKVTLKKQIEDLSREHVAKQQQLKRQSLEKQRLDKQLKKDNLLISMEEDMRDYTKLINYFHKLLYGKEADITDNENKLSSSQSSFTSSSFGSGVGGYQSCSESSSLASSKNSQQFDQSNTLDNLKNQLIPLNLSSSASSKSTGFYVCNELTPLPSPALSTTSSLNTPNSANDDHPPFFCANGSYVMKKKINESNQNRKNKKGKKQNKNAKISHSVEVINLLNQLQIPLNLSSQFEECLKELTRRKYALINEMDTYKFNIEQDQLNRSLQMQAQDRNDTKNSTNCPNTSQAFSDAYSDISSCLDSNYESDNNSVSSFFNRETQTNRKDNLLLTLGSNYTNEAQNVNVTDKLGRELSTVSSTTNSSNGGPANSDDSDVTINESTLNEKELKFLSAQMTKSQNEVSSSNQATITSSNQPLLRVKSTPNKHFNQRQNSDKKLEIKNNFNFFRQVSDGYSSSCTPLSASSITNELPNVNPFFMGSNSAATSSCTLKNDDDPVEIAFLETQSNLNNLWLYFISVNSLRETTQRL